MENIHGLKKRLLLSAKIHKDLVDNKRFMVLVQALLLDRSSPEQVTNFNTTVQELWDLYTGTKKKQKTPEDVNNILKDFQKNYLKPIREKLKNFERAK